MEKQDYSLMTNNEIKLKIMALEDLFEKKKADIKKMCEELEDIDLEYNRAQNEIKLRRNSLY